MNKFDLQKRTKDIAIKVFKFLDSIEKKPSIWAIVQQLIRSSTSVGANYRAACRAKSSKDFLSKLSIVEEEADESIYWLEIIEEILPDKKIEVVELKDEMNQILSIIIASKKTVRNRIEQNRKS